VGNSLPAWDAERKKMEMKKVSAGNLRAIGYDESGRVLQVELTSGTFQYSGVSPEIYRRLASSSSMWSYFRDNIQEELAAKQIR
jgi:hypothetical protein